MTKGKKIFAISCVTVFACIGILCYALMAYGGDYEQHTDELGGVRFLKSDWGMTVREAIASLKTSGIELEDIGSDVSMQTAYLSKEEIEVNGLKGKVQLDFLDGANLIMPYLEDECNIPGGLYSVTIYLNEKDDETVYKAFEKELGDNKQEIVENGKVIGYTSNKVKFTDIKDKKVYNKFSKVIKGTFYEDNKDNLYLNKVTVKQRTRESLEGDYTHVVVLEGRGLATLNNAYRKMLGLRKGATLS